MCKLCRIFLHKCVYNKLTVSQNFGYFLLPSVNQLRQIVLLIKFKRQCFQRAISEEKPEEYSRCGFE